MSNSKDTYFSADQIVGKSLFALKNVPLKRMPSQDAPTIYTVKPNENVGRVYSWVMEGSALWWQFIDQNGNFYYAKHEPGLFSINAIQQQGGKTVEEIKEEKEARENGIILAITKIFKPVIWAAAAFFIIKALRDNDQR